MMSSLLSDWGNSLDLSVMSFWREIVTAGNKDLHLTFRSLSLTHFLTCLADEWCLDFDLQ